MDENAALTMRTDGVSPKVLSAVKNMRVDPNDPNRHCLTLNMDVDASDARFVVDFLQQEEKGAESSSHRRMIVVELADHFLTDEAKAVLCDLLQSPTCPLRALHWIKMGQGCSHPLLEALHMNESIKDLGISIIALGGEMDDIDWPLGGTEGGTMVAQLLLHKPDLEILRLRVSHSRLDVLNSNIAAWTRSFQPGLLQGHPHLQKLSFSCCNLGDEGVHLIVDALVEGNFDNLKILELDRNCISSEGLASLCRLVPSALPGLERLLLDFNPALLDKEGITRSFVQIFLLSQDTILKELCIQNCTKFPHLYNIIIKALETNRTLRLLDIANLTTLLKGASHDDFDDRNVPPLRDQLVESIPKMKGLRYLLCDKRLFLSRDSKHDLNMAFFKSTSLLKLNINFPKGG